MTSRRTVLSACATGVAALAGCSALDVDDGPEYNTDRLATLGEKPLPRPPATFPVSIPDAMRTRHRERARTLIGRVPADPDVPNGVVADRLQRERKEVLEDLSGGETDRNEEYEDALERIDDARRLRAEAATVAAAHRAATGALDPQSIADRREQLRAAALAFERDWTHRGDDPATAAVVHRALEALVNDADRAVTPERALPDPPTADAFRAGEVVARVEAGEAALADAQRLRRRYRDGLTNSRSYRTVLSVAAARLQRRGEFRHRDVHEYADPDAEPPFDRSIEGTALEQLYREAAASVERDEAEAERARRRGDPATALLAAGVDLAALRTLDAVVTGIQEGDIEAPTSAADVTAAREAAVAALERTWRAEPQVVAVELAGPARAYLRHGTRSLGGRTDGDAPTAEDAERAFAEFVRAARYAEAVPPTAADVQAALTSLTGGGG